MEVQGATGNKGVKVKVIETQFVSSDAASFKSVVQRLTGKSAGSVTPHRPRPCRAGGNGSVGRKQEEYWMSRDSMATQEQHAAVATEVGTVAMRAPPPCLEELHEICDFSDLFYVSANDRGGGTRDFPH